MDVVSAAEKSSIADVLSDRLCDRVNPHEIEVHESPSEMGSFLVKWRLKYYVMSPNGDADSNSPI